MKFHITEAGAGWGETGEQGWAQAASGATVPVTTGRLLFPPLLRERRDLSVQMSPSKLCLKA